MVNRGEEKVKVHMNVVPRSTGNTNSGTENRPFSYSRYWTGTSFQVRLMRGSLFKCKLHSSLFNNIPPHEPPLQASSSPILRIRKWPINSEV